MTSGVYDIHRRGAKAAERKVFCLVAETPTRQNRSTLRVIKKVVNYRCEIAGNRLFFAFRPLNGKQNKKLSLRSLRLCGEHMQMRGSP